MKEITAGECLKYRELSEDARKIQDALKRIHGLALSPATIFDLTRRAGEAVRPEYDAI